MNQLSLLPNEKAQKTSLNVTQLRLSSLPADSELFSPQPSKQMVESIKSIGVLSPIWVISDSPYRVVAGRRRIKAARAARQVFIPAFLFDKNLAYSEILTLLENHQRSPNKESDLIAIESLILKALAGNGLSKDELLAELATQLGMDKHLLHRYSKLLALPQELRSALSDGSIAMSTAESLLNAPDDVVSKAVKIISDGNKLTGKAVQEMKLVGRQAVLEDVFEGHLPEPSTTQTPKSYWESKAMNLIANLKSMVPEELTADIETLEARIKAYGNS